MGKTEEEKPSSTSKSKKERLLFPTKVFCVDVFSFLGVLFCTLQT